VECNYAARGGALNAADSVSALWSCTGALAVYPFECYAIRTIMGAPINKHAILAFRAAHFNYLIAMAHFFSCLPYSDAM
jgi:hypothetical protein